MTAEMKKDDPFWIQLDEVPQPGLLLDLDLPQEWQTGVLGPVYAPADRRPHLRLRATRKLDQLSVEGEVELRTRFQCSRCAEPQTRDFHFKVAAVFIPASESELSPDDDDLLLEPDVQVCDYEARSPQRPRVSPLQHGMQRPLRRVRGQPQHREMLVQEVRG
jgi:hypothetical protein